MSDASFFQWIMLLSNIIILGFVIFATIDCCRQKIERKALWLVIIILDFVTIGGTIAATNVTFNFNIGFIFVYNAYITYGGGTNVIRFMLPIGAIIYFILRNSMIRKAHSSENNTDTSEYIQPDEQHTDSE